MRCFINVKHVDGTKHACLNLAFHAVVYSHWFVKLYCRNYEDYNYQKILKTLTVINIFINADCDNCTISWNFLSLNI
jgi:hypothetical protein